jgi:hypothetical protein
MVVAMTMTMAYYYYSFLACRLQKKMMTKTMMNRQQLMHQQHLC